MKTHVTRAHSSTWGTELKIMTTFGAWNPSSLSLPFGDPSPSMPTCNMRSSQWSARSMSPALAPGTEKRAAEAIRRVDPSKKWEKSASNGSLWTQNGVEWIWPSPQQHGSHDKARSSDAKPCKLVTDRNFSSLRHERAEEETRVDHAVVNHRIRCLSAQSICNWCPTQCPKSLRLPGAQTCQAALLSAHTIVLSKPQGLQDGGDCSCMAQSKPMI